MALTRRLQTNFGKGELSAQIEGRSDLAAFFGGASILENFWIFYEGGVFRRYGTAYVNEAKDSTKRCILIPFKFNIEHAYVVEAGDGYFRFYRRGFEGNRLVRIYQNTGGQKITNGTFDTDIAGWTNASIGIGSISWVNGTMKIDGGGTNSPVFGDPPTTYGAARQVLTTVINTEYTVEFDIVTGTGATSHNVVVKIGTSAGTSDLQSQLFSAIGHHSFTFVAATTTTHIELLVTSTFSIPRKYVDNVSVLATNPDAPAEVVTPYSEAELPDLQWAQSADVLFLTHPNHQQQKLSRLSDTEWALTPHTVKPPPTYEAPTDLNTSLSLAALTGTGIVFTTGDNVLLAGDSGRVLTSGFGSGTIASITGANSGTIDIDDPFTSGVVTPIPAGSWFLQGTPQATLDPNKNRPINAIVTLVADRNTFRDQDIGKYIHIYGGIVKITSKTSATTVKGIILTKLVDATTLDPAAAPILSWTLESPAWSDSEGWPSSVEFHQGRLAYGGTRQQPTTWWMSASDSFNSFARGPNAADAVQYTIANRSVNIIEWMLSLKHLFIGDAENEHNARGPGTDQPLGGDVIPYISSEGDEGSLSTMAIAAQRMIIFIQRFARKIASIAYDIQDDAFSSTNLTTHARHIGGDDGFRQHPPVYAKEPNYQVHFPREDGQLASLTVLRKEQVIGWARMATDGEIESVCTVPDKYNKQHDLVFAIKRTINGVTKRYIEIQVTGVDESTSLASRLWRQYNVDCGKDGTILAGAAQITGLDHLEAKTVDVVIGDSYRQTAVVSGGTINMNEAVESNTTYEVGLHYVSTLRTMRPAIQNVVIDGLQRGWKKICLLLHNCVGGKVNGNFIPYPQPPLSQNQLRDGPVVVPDQGSDLNGYITITQDQPYPFALLNLSGTLFVGDD